MQPLSLRFVAVLLAILVGGASSASVNETRDTAPEGRPAFVPGANSGGAGAAHPPPPPSEGIRPLLIQDADCSVVVGCEACVASPGDTCHMACNWWPCG